MLRWIWAGTGLALVLLFAPFSEANAAHGPRPKGFEGTVQIIHTGTAVGAPDYGYTASGSFRYRGKFKLAGNRIKPPQNATISPTKGGWFELGGSGTNSLDMTFDWVLHDVGFTETAHRRWSGGGKINLVASPHSAQETRPL